MLKNIDYFTKKFIIVGEENNKIKKRRPHNEPSNQQIT